MAAILRTARALRIAGRASAAGVKVDLSEVESPVMDVLSGPTFSSTSGEGFLSQYVAMEKL